MWQQVLHHAPQMKVMQQRSLTQQPAAQLNMSGRNPILHTP